MPILKVRTIDLSSFLTFASEKDPLNIIDITAHTTHPDVNVHDFLTSPGCFVYEIRFTVDEDQAFLNGVSDIVFEFFSSKPTARSRPIKNSTFEVKIEDPHLKVKEPTKAIVHLQQPQFSAIAAVAKSVTLVSNRQAVATSPFTVSAKMSEVLDGVDPAQVISSGKLIAATPSKLLGHDTKNEAGQILSRNFDRIGSLGTEPYMSLSTHRNSSKNARKSDQGHPLLDNLLNLNEIVKPTSLVRSHPVSLVEVTSRHEDYTRQLVFDKSSLLGFSKLYMRVSAKMKTGFLGFVKQQVYTISHSNEIKEFVSNPEPPMIVSSDSSHGVVSFLLRKTDPMLRKVSVTRIITSPHTKTPQIDHISTLQFTKFPEVKFEDRVDNVVPNTITYRFIVQNDDGSHGDFTSAVAKSYPKVTYQKAEPLSSAPIAITAMNMKDGIQVTIDTLSERVYAIRLLRQDSGATGELSDTVTTILGQDLSYSQVVNGKKTTLTFVDKEVVTGRHYRYFAAYRLGSSSEAGICLETVSHEDEHITRIRPSDSLPFAASITAGIASQDRQNSVKVDFQLSVAEVEDQFNVLLDSLVKAGVGQQFIVDLQNDRQKARQVAAFIVERVNRTTGRRVSFGVVSPGSFSDSPELRSKLNLPDPTPGDKYEYICKLCIRPPATFLLSALSGFTSAGSAAGDITNILAAKFSNALIERGILPSEKQLRDGTSIRDNFFLGQTGFEISTTVSIPYFVPKIEEFTVNSRNIYDILTWRVTGDTSQISYFLVYCNYNGTDELLGCLPSLGRTAHYQFKDDRFTKEVGRKAYFLRMVNLEHKVVSTSAVSEVITASSHPMNVIVGKVTAQSKVKNQSVVVSGESFERSTAAYDLMGQSERSSVNSVVTDFSEWSAIAMSLANPQKVPPKTTAASNLPGSATASNKSASPFTGNITIDQGSKDTVKRIQENS